MALKSVSMQQGGGGNPFAGGGQQSTALALQGQAVGVPVKLPNGVTVMMSSQQDATAMQTWYANQKQTAMALDGGGGGSMGSGDGMNRALGMAADGAQALSGFLAGRDFTSKLNDYHDAQDRLAEIRDELVRTPSTTPVTPAQMVRLIDAQQDMADAQAAVMETMITAVDIQAGAGAAKVIGRFLNGDSGGGGGGGGGGGMSSGATTALAVGGVGLGALLLSRNNNNTNTRRRGR